MGHNAGEVQTSKRKVSSRNYTWWVKKRGHKVELIEKREWILDEWGERGKYDQNILYKLFNELTQNKIKHQSCP